MLRLPYEEWRDELAGSRLEGHRWVRAWKPSFTKPAAALIALAGLAFLIFWSRIA